MDLIKLLPEEEQTRITTFIDTVKNPYQKNKKMSILIVEVILKNNAKWLEYFKSHSKQDDLADSLLMTLHYFEKQNLNTEAKKSLKKRIKNKNINTVDDNDANDANV